MTLSKGLSKAMDSGCSNIEDTRRPQVATAHFAGRLGGNQEFITSPDDRSLLERQPDAVPLRSLSTSFHLESFANVEIWRMALLEGTGSMLLIFLLGAPAIGLTHLDQTVFAKALYASLASCFALTIFTFCLGPVTGAHINPSITLATFFAGLCTFPRAIVYITAQCIGAVVASFVLQLGVGDDNYFPSRVIPGCTIDASMVSVGQMFILEFMFGFCGIFMAFGVGLDSRQTRTYGPAVGPVLVGITLGLNSLYSVIVRPGYTGASCLGLMSAKHDFQYHWVHWMAQIAATSMNGLLYHIAPPWRQDFTAMKMAANLISRLLCVHKHRAAESRHHD